jgi:hypothetical protein
MVLEEETFPEEADRSPDVPLMAAPRFAAEEEAPDILAEPPASRDLSCDDEIEFPGEKFLTPLRMPGFVEKTRSAPGAWSEGLFTPGLMFGCSGRSEILSTPRRSPGRSVWRAMSGDWSWFL